MKVNDTYIDLASFEGNTLADLIKTLKLNDDRIAIDYNGDIISLSDETKNIILSEEDNIEIIHFAGGG